MTTGFVKKVSSALHLCLLLLTVLFLNGCASTKYNQDYRPGTDFSNLHTYSWRNASSDIAGVDTARLQGFADQQLRTQGYSRVASGGDMLLDMNIISRVSTGRSTGIGLSFGIPIGQHGSIGVGSGKSISNDKLEGVILIDITKAASNSLLWRGSAEGIPLKDFSLQSEAKISSAISQLLAQFPPG